VAALAAWGLLLLAAAPAAVAAAPYHLEVTSASAKVGEQGRIEVSVTATDGFKCNRDYQHRIDDIDGGADVGAPTTVRGKLTGSQSIAYAIPVTPRRQGTHDVTGEIRFSVCNRDGCQVHKVALAAQVTGVR
jgi:hypothetical protein